MYIYMYIHTFHFISFHFITLHYITLHYIYVCIHIRTYVHTYLRTYVCIYIYTHTYVDMNSGILVMAYQMLSATRWGPLQFWTCHETGVGKHIWKAVVRLSVSSLRPATCQTRA